MVDEETCTGEFHNSLVYKTVQRRVIESKGRFTLVTCHLSSNAFLPHCAAPHHTASQYAAAYVNLPLGDCLGTIMVTLVAVAYQRHSGP